MLTNRHPTFPLQFGEKFVVFIMGEINWREICRVYYGGNKLERNLSCSLWGNKLEKNLSCLLWGKLIGEKFVVFIMGEINWREICRVHYGEINWRAGNWRECVKRV